MPPTTPAAPRQAIVMGVSGCGKTVIGQRLARTLGWTFLEGDTLHPPANIAKMQAGHALADADRAPWLAAIKRWLDAHAASGQSSVIACSALKRIYRDGLRQGRPQLRFIYLQVARTELLRRVNQRTDHFMPASLLDSQLATLEPPAADEAACTVDANGPIEHTLQHALACPGLRPHG